MSLQKFALCCLIGSFSLLAHMGLTARAYAEEVRTLEAVMGLMGRSLGPLVKPITQGTAGPAQAAQVHQLLALTVEAQGILPDVVREASADDRPVLEARYIELMQDLTKAVQELETALTNSDVNAARSALNEMVRLRGIGHDEFRL